MLFWKDFGKTKNIQAFSIGWCSPDSEVERLAPDCRKLALRKDASYVKVAEKSIQRYCAVAHLMSFAILEKIWKLAPHQQKSPTGLLKGNRQPLGIYGSGGLGIFDFKRLTFLPSQAVNFNGSKSQLPGFCVGGFHVYFGEPRQLDCIQEILTD